MGVNNMAEKTVKKDAEIEQAIVLATKFQGFVIKTSDDMIAASADLKTVKSLYDKFDDREKEITKPLNEAKKSAIDLFRPVKTALENSKIWLTKQINNYTEEQQRIADEKNRKLQAEADKKAADLRAKAEAELKAGNTAKAEKLQAKAEEKAVSVPIVAANIPKIEGQHTSEKWYHEVVDIAKLDRKYLIANDDMLGKIATATKGTLPIDGVRFFSKKILSSSRK